MSDAQKTHAVTKGMQFILDEVKVPTLQNSQFLFWSVAVVADY